MSQPIQPNQPSTDRAAAIMEAARGFQKSRIILSAWELGVFRELGKGPKTSGEIAAAIGADARATDRLLNALCAIGLAGKGGDSFELDPVVADVLVEGRPGYHGGVGHLVSLYDSWGRLTHAVRKGTRQHAASAPDRGEAWTEPFIAAMEAHAAPRAAELARLVGTDGVARILDVGGGSGAYAIAFARENPGLRVTVLDLPDVVPIAMRYISRSDVADRVDVIAGDYLTDDFGAGFDLVFLSAIIHINDPEENRDLVARAAKALAPGGRVVVQDFIMDEGRTTPPGGAVFALNMLVNTRAGDTYTQAEVAAWMVEAGLGDVSRVDTGWGTALISGRKPR